MTGPRSAATARPATSRPLVRPRQTGGTACRRLSIARLSRNGSTTSARSTASRRIARRPERRPRGRRGVRRAQPGHRCRGDDRLAVPDRVDHQGLDGHGRDGSGRRGLVELDAPVRKYVPGFGSSIRTSPSRSRSGTADALERDRRRPLRRHRPRRRRDRALRGAAPRCGRFTCSGRRCRTATRATWSSAG